MKTLIMWRAQVPSACAYARILCKIGDLASENFSLQKIVDAVGSSVHDTQDFSSLPTQMPSKRQTKNMDG